MLDIIKKIAKKFISTKKNNSNRKPIIQKEEASNALQSVNRKPLNAFTFFERLHKTNNIIDALEERWWNEAGNLIEDVWGLPDDLCLAYREEYIIKAKKIFLEDKKNVKVLDLGCGTGWFGRILADENVFYHGIDFSETQIQIAQQKAKGTKNEAFLKYTKTTSIKSIEKLEEFDAVIINAFLHHLHKEELTTLFDDIKAHFKSGTKIFMMEPTYPTNKTKSNITNLDHIKADITDSTIKAIKKQAIEKKIFDTKKEQDLLELIQESNENGFFFSPKEVPFAFEEIEGLISKYANLKEYFYVGVNDFTFLQMLSLVTDVNFRKEMLEEIYPNIKKMDKELIEKTFYFNGTNNYIFTCFVCVLK